MRPARPGPVTAAAVILIVLGVLTGLFGLLAVLAGAVFPTPAEDPELTRQFGDLSGALGGLLLAIGLITLAFGILAVVTGINVLPGRSWARITGMILATLGLLLSLVGALPGEGSGGVTIAFVVLLAACAFILWALASRGWWFNRAPGY